MLITEEMMREILRVEIDKLGSQKAFANKHDVSMGSLNEMLKGKRHLSETVLHAIGHEKVTAYRQKSAA